MFRMLATALVSILMAAPAAQAVTLLEGTVGEFGDTFTQPTDFTGFTRIEALSNGASDFEYFRFDSLFADTTQLTFTLTNLGNGSNAQIRLSSTPFTMAEWDWTINQIGGSELYANQWSPSATYTFVVQPSFTGPLFGFARFYGTTSPSSLVITQNGTAPSVVAPPPVPLPASVVLMLVGLGGLGILRARRRAA